MGAIDLNADLGEGMPGEDEILTLISSANLAGGGHAGGGALLERSIELCHRYGVAVGAHPSYPDPENFGRISRLNEMEPGALTRSLIDQILLVAQAHGQVLHHVKAHGALYNDALIDERAARAILEAVTGAEIALGVRQIPIMTIKSGVLASLCDAEGRPVIGEVFADRAYLPSGELVPRSEPGAILHNRQEVLDRVLTFVNTGSLTAADGQPINIVAESICLHGDNPAAVELARVLHDGLIAAGYAIETV
jgi:5-oxoprolinase (ATP-hydrolysing) subunit A